MFFPGFLNCWPEVQILPGTPLQNQGLSWLLFSIMRVVGADLPQKRSPLKPAETLDSLLQSAVACGEFVANSLTWHCGATRCGSAWALRRWLFWAARIERPSQTFEGHQRFLALRLVEADRADSLLKERLQFGLGSVSGLVGHRRSFRLWFRSRALEQRRAKPHPLRAATSEEELHACPQDSRYK